jgi:hypothetical protein
LILRHQLAILQRRQPRPAAVDARLNPLLSKLRRVFGAESPPSHQDRLVKFEKAGCQELLVFPKHGWVCVK